MSDVRRCSKCGGTIERSDDTGWTWLHVRHGTWECP